MASREATSSTSTAALTVQEYLDKHQLSLRIEEAVNAAVRARAEEPVSYLADVLRRAAPAVITKVRARQIYDSRGVPTIEVDVQTRKGSFRAAVPSGEATRGHDTSDEDASKSPPSSVSQAIAIVNTVLAPPLIGKDPTKQVEIDQLICRVLEKSGDKTGGGASAILAVSLAVCRAGAAEKGVPLYQHIAELAANIRLVLPVPAFTVINGGRHAGNKLACQDFTILPVGADSFASAMRMGTETYHQLRTVIKEKYPADPCSIGDEGGYAPSISSGREALDLIVAAIDRAGGTGRVKIGLDVVASNLFTEAKVYDLDYKTPNNDGKQKKTGADLMTSYKELCAAYPIVSVGDPFDRTDWENTKGLNAADVCQVVGDELLESNVKTIAAAVQGKWCNGLLVKVHDAGTVSATIDAVRTAKEAGWGVMVGHGSGETDDAFIADLAVGLAAGQFKAGAPCQSERLAKYNQLLRIEEQLGDKAIYGGEDFRHIPWVTPSPPSRPAIPPVPYREIAPNHS
ncbi:enolase [Klebsormidium nitens]|uniref:phosphopyruvate hydratase n=1 Tax=Klebsormidium nitens TaxID=105231 RepID=A0A1Y1II55_KLENI|nr:enolase [Klebsormidium nitens]|eukprot:GAQ87828.1 enolase [Klebsormidium nitens]